MTKTCDFCDRDALAARLADFDRYAHANKAQAQEMGDLRVRLAEETAIVDRIWGIYGRPSYEQLAGCSIYDLINADRARLAEAQRDAARYRWIAGRIWPRSVNAATLNQPDSRWRCDNDRHIDAAMATCMGDKP